MSDLGLFVLRGVVGGFMVSHGLPKLSDRDGEYAKSFEGMGFRPGSQFVARAGAVETASGVLIGLGWLGPLGPMLLLSDMIVAAVAVASREGSTDPRKHELEAAYAAAALLLALSGPGNVSLDRVFRMTRLNTRWLRRLSVAAALAGAAAMLAQRRPGGPA